MQSNYKSIGNYIRLVDERNKELKVTTLLGLSISKEFIPSVANTVGTNMRNYKIIRKNQFACSIMQVRRDGKMPVALLEDIEEAIISQAYPVFEIIDTEVLLPQYLMMWFTRSEFDRQATFHAVGGVRGSLEWEDFLAFELPVPSIEQQREIVREYNVIKNRIALNQQLNKKLEETAQVLYKNRFWDNNLKMRKTTLGKVTSLITDGKHGNCKDEVNSGYYFLSAKDIRESLVYKDSREITKKDFDETHRRTDLRPYDICLVNTGATIGRMCLAPNLPKTFKTTFQKSVAVIKPKSKISSSFFLYCLLKTKMPEIIELGKGTSQPNLLIGDLKAFEVEYPPLSMIDKFEQAVTPIFTKIEINYRENLKLKKLRELLLSKMVKVEKDKTFLAYE